jgi:hypothetical protein
MPRSACAGQAASSTSGSRAHGSWHDTDSGCAGVTTGAPFRIVIQEMMEPATARPAEI